MSGDRTPRLAIAEDQITALRTAAADAHPREFCALLLGTGDESGPRPRGDEVALWRVTRLVFAANVDPRPERGFELDPSVLIDVLRDLREAERGGCGTGERLLGHAHSHPDALAQPSARDLALIHESGLIWLIVPTHAGQAGAPRAFQAVVDDAGLAAFKPVRLVRHRHDEGRAAARRGSPKTP